MNPRIAPRALLALLLVAVLFGCRPLAGSEALSGTQWVLSAIDGLPPLPGGPITLAFEDGQVRGGSGCNSYSGTYTVRGETLAIGELMATAMACAEPDRMEQESAYLERLGAVTSFTVADGVLGLSTSHGQSLTFALLP
jgi:heat shock protein HslJ